MEEFLKKSDWKYDTSLENTKMTLTRQVDDVNVKVVYHARSPTFQDE